MRPLYHQDMWRDTGRVGFAGKVSSSQGDNCCNIVIHSQRRFECALLISSTIQISANISHVRRLRNPYRRWLLTGLLFFGWCGLVPIVLFAGYYAVTPSTDFDPALAKLRSGPRPQHQLGWVVRIGGSSVHWKGVAFVSNWAGYNADDAEAQRRRHQVFEAAGLTETRSATYLAKFHGSLLPVVITAFRDVNFDGCITYDVVLNGRRPIASCFLFLVGSSIFAVIFFELVRVAQHRRR